jgi:chromosome segregation ATPase
LLPEPEVRRYFDVLYKKCCTRFGAQHIVSAKVHMDETTPHLHLCYIPVALGKDGRPYQFDKKGRAKISMSAVWESQVIGRQLKTLLSGEVVESNKYEYSYSVLQEEMCTELRSHGFDVSYEKKETAQDKRDHRNTLDYQVAAGLVKVEKLNKKIEGLEEKRGELENQLDVAREGSSADKVAKLEKKLEKVERDLAAKTDERNDVQKALDDLKLAIDPEQPGSPAARYRALEEELDEDNPNSAAAQAKKLRSERDDIKDDIGIHEARRDVVKSVVESKTKEMDELIGKIADKTRELDSVKNEVGTLDEKRTELEGIKSDITTKTAERDALTMEIASKTKELRDSLDESKSGSLAAQIRDKRAELETVKDDLDVTKPGSAAARIGAMKRDLDAAVPGSLAAQVSDRKAELGGIKSDIPAKTKELDALTKALDATDPNSVAGRVKTMRAELEGIKSDIATKTKELDTLTKALDASDPKSLASQHKMIFGHLDADRQLCEREKRLNALQVTIEAVRNRAASILKSARRKRDRVFENLKGLVERRFQEQFGARAKALTDGEAALETSKADIARREGLVNSLTAYHARLSNDIRDVLKDGASSMLAVLDPKGEMFTDKQWQSFTRQAVDLSMSTAAKDGKFMGLVSPKPRPVGSDGR